MGHHYGVYAGNGKMISYRGGVNDPNSGRIYIEDLHEMSNRDYPMNFKMEPSKHEMTRKEII